MKASPAFLFGAGATCLVAVSIIAAAAVMGSPASFRARRLDEQRVENLRTISRTLKEYYQAKKKLPESLSAFAHDFLPDYGPDYAVKTRDPETGEGYEYTVTGPQAYRLCATFQTLADGSPDGATYYRLGGDFIGPNNFWRHGVGRQCFDFTVKTAKPDKP